jgi:threonine/homoserine/homoserine lactone efflux protein
MSFAFLLTSLIVVVSPGTGVIYTLASALSGGARAAVAASIGCTLGIVPAMLAAMVGLAAVLHTSAANLKFLSALLQVRHRNFKFKAALENMSF